LLASVTRLSPRISSFEDALVAFRAARLQTCLSHLSGIKSVPAALLRARTFLRTGDPGSARATLHVDESSDLRNRGEVALLLRVSLSRLGEEERSNDALQEAHVFSISSADTTLEAEVEYYRGAIALGNRDLHEGRAACLRGLEIANSPVPFGKAHQVVPLAHVVSRIEELLGIIEAGDGHYRGWLDYARKALATLDSCVVSDAYQEAFALRNLAILARDFDTEDDARILAARVPKFAWTEDVRRVEFATIEALGWCSALHGDAVEALRLFRRANNLASTDPERILVGVDRTLFAREFGHRPMVLEELEHAFDLADTFDWETAAGDYRLALLALAQAAAPITQSRARITLDRYTSIRNSMDSTFSARIEPRARAEEAYTHGLVLRAEGRLTASTEHLQTAFETWNRIGYEWRAGRAALELAELDAGEVFRLAVRRELFQRPDSVFATRARLVA